jgi:N,N'-diacetyllegionaminate synthase
MIGIYIIAEAGVNHNGDIRLARKMVDCAVEAGADAVKFQAFRASAITIKDSPKAEYQKLSTDRDESQFDMIRKLELSLQDHRELKSYCADSGIDFLSSPFDLESVDMLLDLGMETFKIPSGEITNLPYLRKIGKLNRRVILSTGMSELSEVEAALDVLTCSGTGIENITVLHCNTEYPTPFEDVNLSAMLTMREILGVKTGYSDHTPGIEIAIAAAALGAYVIEKHFTLDKTMVGPDHKASLDPGELSSMVRAVRNIERSLGDGRKVPSGSEIKNIGIVRKSIVAAVHIKRGESFTEENLTVKRPGHGIDPMQWDNVIGKKASKDFEPDEMIRF